MTSPEPGARTNSTSPMRVKPGAENVLAVQVFAPTENDLAITFVDWNPAPPDKNMGLWREVYLTTSGPVALRYPTVVSKLNLPEDDSARLTVTAQVKNGSNHPVKGKLKGQIENVAFEQPVELAANESKDVTFTPDQFSQLVFSNPRLWWPAQMGKPNLYPLTMEFEIDGAVSDRSHTEFGIREITSEINAEWRTRIPHQRQEHSDSRRRLDSRHDVARRFAAIA